MTDNPSGIWPVEYNVLVDPEQVETVTKGGIILSDTTKEADEAAQVRGRIAAASPFAFSYETDWPEAQKPGPGDVVIYAKYGGVRVQGSDGKEYRLLKDKDIAAVIRD